MADKSIEAVFAKSNAEAKELVEQGWEFAGFGRRGRRPIYKRDSPAVRATVAKEQALVNGLRKWIIGGFAGGSLTLLAVVLFVVLCLGGTRDWVTGLVDAGFAAFLGIVALAVSSGDKPTPGAQKALSAVGGAGVGVAFMAAIGSLGV